MNHTNKISSRMFWMLTWVGTTLVLVSSLPYLLPGQQHPFLLERPWLTSQWLWKSCLELHIGGGMLCLPVGLLLFSGRLVRGFPRMHRWMGRIFVVGVVVVMFPTGVYLAAHAKFGWATGAGFLLSNVIATWTAISATRFAMQRRFGIHRDASIRCVAQLGSAITFRVYHIAFQLLDVAYEPNYISSLWMSVLGNALFAEVLIYVLSKKGISHANQDTSSSDGPHRTVPPFGLATGR